MGLDTHVYLVSQQATPNLTPALDLVVQPRRVVLVVSQPMRDRARWLAEVLRPRGIRVEQWPVHDPWDIESLKDCLIDLLAREEEAVSRKGIALNATGGTKPMSIAAYEVFRAEGLPIFYVHPERDRLVWLSPSAQPDVALENRIRLEDFLLAHGARLYGKIERNRPSEPWVTLSEGLVRDVEQLGRALRAVNALAGEAQAYKSLCSERRIQDTARITPAVDDLVERLEKAGVASVSQDRLCFPSEEARFFVNGGWLELHAFRTVRDLRRESSPIQDAGRGIRVSRTVRHQEIPNELDVALLAENRLYIVECKTRQWRNPGADGPGAEALYKLDTLSDLLGGLQARAMMISYQEVPAPDRQRAADLGIEVCAGCQILRLREFLQGWIRRTAAI